MEHLEENRGELYICLVNNFPFFGHDTKSTINKSKIKKCIYMKLKASCRTLETISKMRQTYRIKENICNPTSLIRSKYPKIYKTHTTHGNKTNNIIIQ